MKSKHIVFFIKRISKNLKVKVKVYRFRILLNSFLYHCIVKNKNLYKKSK